VSCFSLPGPSRTLNLGSGGSRSCHRIVDRAGPGSTARSPRRPGVAGLTAVPGQAGAGRDRLTGRRVEA